VSRAPRRNSKASRGDPPGRPAPLKEAHRRLLRRYGPLRWWPAETPLEVCVGAVLTQNTSWSGVVKALDNLRAAGVLGDAEAMLALPKARLAELLRPSGYFRLKARRLRALLAWIAERGGDPVRALRGDAEALRASLLGVHGVGRETADSILLYAAGHPIFVVDAYTRRVLGRHRWFDPEAGYDTIRGLFEGSLPRDAALYNQFHAEIVMVGKDHCRPSPRCEGCPLEGLLPAGYPRPGGGAMRTGRRRQGSA
jgi:endonuclease-3 related protein